MRDVFIVSDNIYSPIGKTTQENLASLKRNESGIALHQDPLLSPTPFYASLFQPGPALESVGKPASLTKFEGMLVASIEGALKGTGISLSHPLTGLVISSTKGNISLIESGTMGRELSQRISLHQSAARVAGYFGSPHPPVIVSNACISGLLALLTGMRLIQGGHYEQVLVSGCDLITKFILSGFQSFMAISGTPCRPFDKDRDGITLGEAAATILLSARPIQSGSIRLTGGALSNDANHISGPSRTGEELALAIQSALRQAKLKASEIDFISAHGTATVYNDEMEAKAISLLGMESVPVNSLKGHYGHTLGAAGLIESVISIHSLQENMILPTRNFREAGLSKPINICSTLQTGHLRNGLKTASGFGGCNAALVFSK